MSGSVHVLSKEDQRIIDWEFFSAVKDGNLDKVKYFVNGGAKINDQNDGGLTALHIAVENEDTEIIKFLLENGALCDIKNDSNETSLDVAQRLKNETILQLFPLQTKPKASQGGISRKKDPKRPDPIHGRLYELKLLMLFLHRGVSNHYSFHLSKEFEEAKKLDDLCFKYEENGQIKFRLLQAKHVKNPTNIVFKELLTEGDKNFSLVKYFFSYVDAQKSELFKDGMIENVIVCTNRDLDLNDLKDCGLGCELIKGFDDILDTKDSSLRYKFVQADLIPKLKPLLESYNLTRLARRLVQCLLNSNFIGGSVESDIFFRFQGAIAKDIINTETQLFHDNFIEGKIPNLDTDKFRNIFIHELSKQSKEKIDIKNLNEAIENKKVVIGPKAMGILLSKNFGKVGSSQWPTDAISDADIVNYVNALVFAVNQPDEEELGQIIKNEIGQNLDLDLVETENMYNKFFMTMLNWYQGKERGRFLSSEEGKEFFEEAKRGLPVLFNIQNPVNSFTGREEELKNLHEALQNCDGVVVSQSVSVSGLGGVGKTELIRKYISEHYQNYDSKVVWINAENYNTLSESFRRLASDKLGLSPKNNNGEKKEIKSIVEDVYRFFSKGKSLFIFDHAVKFKGDDGISEFLCSLPGSTNKPNVLITSCNIKWPDNIKLIKLGVFTPKEANAFIKNVLKFGSNSHDEDVTNLARTLQYFPLALQQAVAYIKMKNEELENVGSEFRINDYLKRYEEKKEELLDFQLPEDCDNTYTKTTFTTWAVSLDRIKASKNGDEALEILNIIAYLAPDYISTDIFSNYVCNEEKLGSIIYLLKQYSMVSSEQDQSLINVHRLVQQVTRINSKNKEKEILRKALKLFQAVDWKTDPRLNDLDHAVSVWRYASEHEKLAQEFSQFSESILEALVNEGPLAKRNHRKGNLM